MKRDSKIKAYFILVAWLTIFLHNTIPHNHIGENTGGCHELIHTSPHGTDDEDKSCKLVSLPSDIKICHISGLLFQSFNADNLIIHPSKDISFSYEVAKSPVIVYTDQPYISDHFHGSTSFRAPPAA